MDFSKIIAQAIADGASIEEIVDSFIGAANDRMAEDKRKAEEAEAKAKAEALAKAKEQEMIADARDLIATMTDFLTKWNIGLPLDDPKKLTDEEILSLINELRSLNDVMNFIDGLFKKNEKPDDDGNIMHTPVKAKPHKVKINFPNPDEFAKIFRAFLND